MYKCGTCLQSLLASSFSKSQVNKLEHKKVDSIKCFACTEQAVIAKDGLPKVKVTAVVVEKKAPRAQFDPSLTYIKNPDRTPIIEDAITFAKEYDLDYKVRIGPIQGWRTVVKLAVRGVMKKNKRGQDVVSTTMGLFKPGSHTVVSCTESTAHNRTINKALVHIEEARKKANVEGYIEGTGYDAEEVDANNCFLKYVLLTLARQSNKVQLSLVWNTEPAGHSSSEAVLARFINALLSENAGATCATTLPESSDLFHSVWVNYNPSSRYNNAITGRGEQAWKLMFGERYAREIVATNMNSPPQLMFPPFVFRQANICAFTNIICNIRNWIQDMVDKKYPVSDKSISDTHEQVAAEKSSKKRKAALLLQSNNDDGKVRGVKCVELYAGVGTIGLNCLDLLSELNCSDENPHNLACFEAARLSMSPESIQDRASYRSEPAGAVAASGGLRGFELILVDPPRKGLDDEVLQAMLYYDDSGATRGNNHTHIGKKTYLGRERGGGGEVVDHQRDAPINSERLIYVSCGFPAFKRDAARLTGRVPAGKEETGPVRYWKLVHMEGHVLFPGSDHIETLAIFDRL